MFGRDAGTGKQEGKKEGGAKVPFSFIPASLNNCTSYGFRCRIIKLYIYFDLTECIIDKILCRG